LIALVSAALSRFRHWLTRLLGVAAPAPVLALPSAPTAAATPDTPDTRAAVHEAGHTLVAWYCTAVTDVYLVSIDVAPEDPRAGFVSYRMAACPAAWAACTLVVRLAGLAAELLAFGTFNARESGRDLASAREVAEELVSSGRSLPAAWSRVTGPAPPFAAMFEVAPAPEVAEVLAQAYRVARALLVASAPRHTALTGSLLHGRRLVSRDVERALGSRVGVRLAGLFKSGFVGLEVGS